MPVDELYDLFNYQTNGKELEKVYNLVIRKVISNLERGEYYFNDILDGKGELSAGTIEAVMNEVYPSNKKPKSPAHFYPLHFLRQLRIVDIKKEGQKDIVVLNRDFALKIFTDHGLYIELPLSCLILEQLRGLPEENINKYYYYVIRKVIYENRVIRYGANKEVDLILKTAPHFEKSDWRPNINHVKYGFFANVVDYFYFEKNSYIFNFRFIRDILNYVLITKKSQYIKRYSQSLQKFFETVNKKLITVTTINNSIFRGFLVGLLGYSRYCDLSNIYENEIAIELKLGYKTDIGLIYEFDYDEKTGNRTQYDFIQIISRELKI